MTKKTASAFPNAYVDVDEPPNNAPRVRILALVGMISAAFLGSTTLVLNFLPTGYDPVRQMVSDYAVGAFAFEMQLAFFAGGLGVVALASAVAISDDRRVVKAGSALLFIAGVCLFAVGAFQTDVEGAAATLHGTVHDILSQFVFVFGPIGMLLVSHANGSRWLWPTLASLAAAGAFFAADAAFSLNAAGLAERIFILVLLVWWFTASYRLFRTA
ncbi:MAG: DUF998 domain-containing protein [Thaumarchaeota archaeon]|nr:DUF998 domain-containing protein [Nitrososphaerota archaeon]